MTERDDAPALFAAPGVASTVQDACRRSIATWGLSGVVVSEIAGAGLLAQAHAVDLAIANGRPTNVSGANRVLLEMLHGLGLLGKNVPAADPEWDALVRDLRAGDDEPATPPP